MKIKYQNKTLTIHNHTVELPFTIKDVIQFKNQIITIIDDRENLPLDTRLLDQNIYAFDTQAHELWKIQECPHGGNRPKPYMGIKINENGNLIASNMIGVDYIVDLENGKVEPYGSGIRPW